MARGSLVCLLVVVLVVAAATGAFAQDVLWANWMSDNSGGNPATGAPGFRGSAFAPDSTVTVLTCKTTTKSPGCTASLDVQTNGNPNCPQDQQFFDTDSCQFVCLSTQTPPRPAPASQERVVP